MQCPAKTKKLMLQLQQYDIEVIHFRGKSIPLGDALIRNYVSETVPNLIGGLDAHVRNVLRSLPVSDMKIKQIKDASRGDTQMQLKLKQKTKKKKTGWSQMRQDCPKIVLEYWNHRDELSCANDIVFKGQKLVNPTSVREEIIKAVHIGHFGVVKSVGRTRDKMFWLLMSKQITCYMLGCTFCH